MVFEILNKGRKQKWTKSECRFILWQGMVEGKDGQWIYFDMVPGEADIREGSADYTGRICVIGSKIQEDKLSELFGI